jgi:GNAT superfamily N-acetyltransferase
MVTVEIPASQASPPLRALFSADEPAGIRVISILGGVQPGRIVTDDLNDPTWAIMQEMIYGTMYLGGAVQPETIAQFIAEHRHENDVLIGLWPGDGRRSLLPDAEYEGTVIDFTNRPVGQGLDAYLRVPDGCEIRQVDAALFGALEDAAGLLATYGSVERALDIIIGFCLLVNGVVVCEAVSGPPIGDIIEVGMTTREAYRRRGYATVTCAHLIHACEARGYQTYWNSNAANLPSVAIARKLGYRTAKEYQMFGWLKTNPAAS